MAVLLIVEDESMLRSSMVRGLSKLPDLTIAEAGTIKQALGILSSQRPSLVISDLDLPDGSGIELLSAMDRLKLRAPLIYISAYLDRYRSRIPSRSDVDMCEKPIRLEALRQLVQSRLAKPDAPEGLPPFTIEEYIQLACMGQHSIQIKLENDHQMIGQVVIRTGEVWSAEDGVGTGEEALRRLLANKGLRVICNTLREQPGPRNIGAQPWFGLLLEAAKQRDEGSRDGASPEDGAASGAPAAEEPIEEVFSDLKRMIDAEDEPPVVGAPLAPLAAAPLGPPPPIGAGAPPAARLVAPAAPPAKPAPNAPPVQRSGSSPSTQRTGSSPGVPRAGGGSSPALASPASPSSVAAARTGSGSIPTAAPPPGGRAPTNPPPAPAPRSASGIMPPASGSSPAAGSAPARPAAAARSGSSAGTVRPAAKPPAKTPEELDFERLVTRGVEAALDKNYAEALRAFLAAQKVNPADPTVQANIKRLEQLGYKAS